MKKIILTSEKGGLSISKIRRTLAAAVLVVAFIATLGSPVYSVTNEQVVKPNAQLTEAQKQEIAALHKDILAKKKQLVNKYVEFGVISEEKGKKIISRMEQRYQKLEQNGFIPKWEKTRYKR